MSIESTPEPEGRIAGSFRDPSGYVFSRGEDIFRALDDDCHQLLRGLHEKGILDSLIEKGVLVPSSFVEDEPLRGALAEEQPGFEHFVRHERLPLITYPYEWSISMLADAAILTLDLQKRLLESECSLKDATAYNVQFVEGRPRFIDLSSIERPERLDVWFALGQFTQMFLFPLFLTRYRGWNLRSYFLGNLGGLAIEEVASNFGRLEKLRPRFLLDLTLPLWLHRWAEKGDRARRETLEKPKRDPRAQLLNLGRLRKKVEKLAVGYKPRGVWADYTKICNYDDQAEEAKKTLVGEFLESTEPSRVLDLGCNTGDYSRLAADRGAEVIAVDADHDAVELLYRGLRDNPARIHPMVIDLCNPSPGIGYMNRERPPLLERVQADCTLALALVHHLLVSGNLPLEAICELLSALTRRDLVVEFVPTDDGMFRRLLKFRVDLFDGVTLESFRVAFLTRFQLVKEVPIPGSKRTLFFLRKRDET